MTETRPDDIKTGSPSQTACANLDLLRSTAVLLVYLHHLLLTRQLHYPVDIGHLGVLLFFVHTSLVLMLSLSRLQARGEALVRSFYIKRFFRLYPLSVFCVLAITLGGLPRAPWWPHESASAFTLATNLLLCMNLFYVEPVTSVLWSLPYEVQMMQCCRFCFWPGAT